MMTDKDIIVELNKENLRLNAQVQDLVRQYNHLERERDAAVADLTRVMKETFSDDGMADRCRCCKHTREKCWEMHRCEWEWRGVQNIERLDEELDRRGG